MTLQPRLRSWRHLVTRNGFRNAISLSLNSNNKPSRYLPDTAVILVTQIDPKNMITTSVNKRLLLLACRLRYGALPPPPGRVTAPTRARHRLLLDWSVEQKSSLFFPFFVCTLRPQMYVTALAKLSCLRSVWLADLCPPRSVMQVHTSHELVQTKFIQKKRNKFTFIVHQFSFEIVNVQFKLRVFF